MVGGQNLWSGSSGEMGLLEEAKNIEPVLCRSLGEIRMTAKAEKPGETWWAPYQELTKTFSWKKKCDTILQFVFLKRNHNILSTDKEFKWCLGFITNIMVLKHSSGLRCYSEGSSPLGKQHSFHLFCTEPFHGRELAVFTMKPFVALIGIEDISRR